MELDYWPLESDLHRSVFRGLRQLARIVLWHVGSNEYQPQNGAEIRRRLSDLHRPRSGSHSGSTAVTARSKPSGVRDWGLFGRIFGPGMVVY